MYFCSNGTYECRSDDCPPGTRAALERDSKEGDALLAKLRRLPPSLFASVDDLAEIVWLCNQSVPMPSGKILRGIEKRLR